MLIHSLRPNRTLQGAVEIRRFLRFTQDFRRTLRRSRSAVSTQRQTPVFGRGKVEGLISINTAQNIILRHSAFRKIYKVRVDAAINRVLAEDVYALCDDPEFDRSVMDGFAVKSSDIKKTPAILKVLEYIPAGKIPRRKIKKGECAQIATGAMLPRGADAVVMKEDAHILKDSRVEILRTIKNGAHIYRKALHFKKGDLLFKKGTALNMAAVALLSSIGIKMVKIFGAPTVAILSTGNEIVEPGLRKGPACVWNSTRPMLTYVLRSMNIEPRFLGIASDSLPALKKKIKTGLKYDILIVTGAVSIGELDLVPVALKNMGITPLFHKVCIRPGKPLLFAVHGQHLIFGLPGNPVSSMISFLLFIKPCLKKILGQKENFVIKEGILSKGVYNDSGRISFLPGRLKFKAQEYIVKPLPYSGSADLKAISQADVFFILDKKQTYAVRNTRVPFMSITE